MTTSKDAIVARAKAYPFAPPTQSYVLIGDRSVPLDDTGEALANTVREGGGVTDTACAYLSLHGCLNADGENVALAAVEAEGVPFRTLDQVAVLSLVRDRLAPGTPLDDFIHETVTDESLRTRRIAILRETASPSPTGDGRATRIL